MFAACGDPPPDPEPDAGADPAPPTIGPELELDHPVPGTPTITGDTAPAVGSDGTGFLVVWEDRRNGFTQDIYGARIAPDGTHLDPLGIPLVTDAGAQLEPALAWNGASYLLVWRDCEGQAECFGGTGRIRAMRLSAAGVPLDAAPVDLSPPPSRTTWAMRPRVASDGDGFLVVWDGTDEIGAARVTADGDVLDPGGLQISSSDHSESGPEVASNGDSYLVTWRDSDDSQDVQIRGALVVDGIVQAPIAISPSGYADDADVASDGTDYLVAWISYTPALSERRVFGNRVSAAGAVLDGAGLDLGVGPGFNTRPSVAWSGTEHVVVWERCESGGVCADPAVAIRVTSGGVVLGEPVPLATDGAQEQPVIAAASGSLLVAWVEGPYGGEHVIAERVSPALEVLAPFRFIVSLGPNQQYGAAVAVVGDGALVVWTDNRNGVSEIYGARLSTAGEVLDPDAIRIGIGRWARVASNGVDYLVAWSTEDDEIRAARVSAAGEVLDLAPLALSPVNELSHVGPVVASAGGDYLVAWTEVEYPIPEIMTANRQVLGTIVTADGAVRNPGGFPLDDGGRGSAPSIASNGEAYLLAWRDCRSGCPEDLEGDTHAARIGADSTVLDATSITFPERYADVGPRPEVASDGDGFLVLAIRGAARVSADGAVLDDAWVELDGVPTGNAAFGAGTYLVVGDTFGGGVRGARLSSSGAALDPTGFTLADGEGPALAYVPAAGGFLVVYTRGYRNYARFVTP